MRIVIPMWPLLKCFHVLVRSRTRNALSIESIESQISKRERQLSQSTPPNASNQSAPCIHILIIPSPFPSFSFLSAIRISPSYPPRNPPRRILVAPFCYVEQGCENVFTRSSFRIISRFPGQRRTQQSGRW